MHCFVRSQRTIWSKNSCMNWTTLGNIFSSRFTTSTLTGNWNKKTPIIKPKFLFFNRKSWLITSTRGIILLMFSISTKQLWKNIPLICNILDRWFNVSNHSTLSICWRYGIERMDHRTLEYNLEISFEII